MGRGGAAQARVPLEASSARPALDQEMLRKITERKVLVYAHEVRISFTLDGQGLALVVEPRPWATRLQLISWHPIDADPSIANAPPYECLYERCGRCVRCTLYEHLEPDMLAVNAIREQYSLEVGARMLTVRFLSQGDDISNDTRLARLSDDVIAWDKRWKVRGRNAHEGGIVSRCGPSVHTGSDVHLIADHLDIPQLETLPALLNEAAARSLAAGRDLNVFEGPKSMKMRLFQGELGAYPEHESYAWGTLVAADEACCAGCEGHPHTGLQAFVRRARELEGRVQGTFLDRLRRRI